MSWRELIVAAPCIAVGAIVLRKVAYYEREESILLSIVAWFAARGAV